MSPRGTPGTRPGTRAVPVDLRPIDLPQPTAAPVNPQVEFELAMMAALGLEGRADVLRMTLDVEAGKTTATVVFAAPVIARPELAGALAPRIQRFRLVPVDGGGA